jgi:LPXTG-motif cell wall-anchored protein
MTSKLGVSWIKASRFLVGILCVAAFGSVQAQVQTEQSTTKAKASKEVQVERGEVVLVDGNDLVIKMEDGTIRHFPNVPDSARVNVDGRQLGVHDLKPGMKLQRTITTTSTPQVVTTVQTVTGKVWHVTPPNSVILTMENGENQTFKIPKGQKFTIDGKEVDAFGLKKGMKVSATKIVESPDVVVSQQRQVSGTMPPPPPAPAADAPMLIAVAAPTTPPTSAPAETPAPEKKLPKTASNLPLLGLMGVLLIGASFILRFVRTAVAR